jgi:hypothetical protein
MPVIANTGATLLIRHESARQRLGLSCRASSCPKISNARHLLPKFLAPVTPSWRRTLLNNGDAKTPNGDFRHFGGLVPRVRLQFSKRRLPEPAYLAIPAGLLLNSGERQFAANVWLPGMDSNHELDRFLKSRNLLILQSR